MPAPAWGVAPPKAPRGRRKPPPPTDADPGKPEQAHKQKRRRDVERQLCPRCERADWSVTYWQPETRTWACGGCEIDDLLPGMRQRLREDRTLGEPTEAGGRWAPTWRGWW